MQLRTTWIHTFLCGAMATGALACGTSDGGADGDGTDGSGSSTGPGDIDTDGNSGAMSSATSGGTAGTTASPTSGPDDTTSVGVDSGDGMETFGFITAATDDGPVAGVNGDECQEDTECVSGFCFPFMMGGVCSECIADVDCEMGTCSLDFGTGYAVCTDGGLGVSCDSDRGCMGDYVCATVFVTGGGNPIDHCSECDEDAPCAGGDACVPVYDDGFFGAYFVCAAPGSVADGGGCPVDDQGVGDGSVCASGQCGVATVGMGNFTLGICSECDADDDCTEPQTCAPPTVMMGNVTPGACQ